MAQTRLRVPGMSCDHCKATVSRALTKLAGVSHVDVDLASKDVSVTHDTKVSLVQLKQAVEGAGYTVG